MGLPPLAKAEPAMAHPFVGSLFIAFLAFALLSWLYFFIAPLIIEPRLFIRFFAWLQPAGCYAFLMNTIRITYGNIKSLLDLQTITP